MTPSIAIEGWSSDECGLSCVKAQRSNQTECTCGQAEAVQRVLQVLSVKVETCYDLGWILSLYDTLHRMWQD